MKARGLIIGSLIKAKSGAVGKVIHLTHCTINAMPEDSFDPILLTPEILEKNGFYRCSLGVNSWFYVEHCAKEEGENQCTICVRLRNDSYFIEIENTYNDDALYERTQHFVHELQHALRLCGLNELADNFKV